MTELKLKKPRFIYKESIVNPLNEFEPNYNKKEDYIFLVTIDLLKF